MTNALYVQLYNGLKVHTDIIMHKSIRIKLFLSDKKYVALSWKLEYRKKGTTRYKGESKRVKQSIHVVLAPIHVVRVILQYYVFDTNYMRTS